MTTAGVVYGGVAQGQGQPGGPGGRGAGTGRRIVFTPLVKTATVELLNVPAVIVDF